MIRISGICSGSLEGTDFVATSVSHDVRFDRAAQGGIHPLRNQCLDLGNNPRVVEQINLSLLVEIE